jgi:hypothetical protein
MTSDMFRWRRSAWRFLFQVVAVALDARLAEAELETKAGQTAEGRVHLTAIEADAMARRCNLVALVGARWRVRPIRRRRARENGFARIIWIRFGCRSQGRGHIETRNGPNALSDAERLPVNSQIWLFVFKSVWSIRIPRPASRSTRHLQTTMG